MSIVLVESFESVLLDDNSTTYEVTAVVEDQVVTRPAVYNPPGLAAPEELGPGLCWVSVEIPHREDIDPENKEQFKNYLNNQNLDWSICEPSDY